MIEYLDCRASQTMLEAFVDGELAVEAQVALESHLRWCRVCAARVEDMQLIGASLRVTSCALRATDQADDSLTGAESEPDRDQQRDSMRHAGRKKRSHSGCDAPPQHANGKNSPRAEARCKPSSRELKTGVSDQEGAEDPPQPLVAESVLRADLQPRD